MAIRNVHERVIEAPVGVLGPLLDAMGGDGDRLWPSPAWVPMRLDGSVAVGASGGHGPVRYHVSEWEPGRRVRFEFGPKLGLRGYHELSVHERDPQSCVVRHVLAAHPEGTMRVLWPAAVRPLHDAVLEDLLDNAEREATGSVAQPAVWSRWVRVLRHLEFPRPRSVEVPAEATLLEGALERVDRADAWQVGLAPGVTRDAARWAQVAFSEPPEWVARLLRLRNALVGLVGIDRADESTFEVMAERDGEVLVGADEAHLGFRASVLVGEQSVTASTVVQVHNRRGRLYMAVVWPVHGRIMRSMLHRAQRRLIDEAVAAGAAGGRPVPEPVAGTSAEAADDRRAVPPALAGAATVG